MPLRATSQAMCMPLAYKKERAASTGQALPLQPLQGNMSSVMWYWSSTTPREPHNGREPSALDQVAQSLMPLPATSQAMYTQRVANTKPGAASTGQAFPLQGYTATRMWYWSSTTPREPHNGREPSALDQVAQSLMPLRATSRATYTQRANNGEMGATSTGQAFPLQGQEGEHTASRMWYWSSTTPREPHNGREPSALGHLIHPLMPLRATSRATYTQRANKGETGATSTGQAFPLKGHTGDTGEVMWYWSSISSKERNGRREKRKESNEQGAINREQRAKNKNKAFFTLLYAL